MPLGARVGLFPPDMAFEVVAKQQIKSLKEPSLECISLVVQELSEVLLNCCDTVSFYMGNLSNFIFIKNKYLFFYYLDVTISQSTRVNRGNLNDARKTV